MYSVLMEEQNLFRFTGADVAVLASYFVLVIGIGIFAMYRTNKETIGGYFLAGRSMRFPAIAASLFVSNIGSQHFIGLAGSGAARGISVGAWEIHAVTFLQVTGWLFLPVYIACGTYTMPQYLSKRFGGNRLQLYYAALSIILYVFTKCSITLYTGATFIQQALNWDLYVSIAILVVITATLTITGGLTAVMYTDTLQATLMVGGSLYLMGRGFYEIGGFSGLLEKYPQAVPTNVSAIVPGTTCHHPDPKAFTMLRDITDDYMPWLGFLIGQTPVFIWYWCIDQVIVQRALAARSLSHAQGGTLLAGLLKIVPLFVMVFPGMISRILFPNEVACTNPDYCMKVCQSRAGCSSIAYPKLVTGLMPSGARGLMMAVIVAAIMSDLDSIFNSASALFTIDIWKKIRKSASVMEQMVVGRLFIVAMVAVSIGWVPVIKETQGGQIVIYINQTLSYLAPPFSAVFLLAVLCPKVNEKGAFWAVAYAFVVGVIRLVLAMVYEGETYCGSTSTSEVPNILANFQFMYFSLFLFASTGAIAIIVSYFTAPIDDKYLKDTTFWSYYKRKSVEDTYDIDVNVVKTRMEPDDTQVNDEQSLQEEHACNVMVDATSDKRENKSEHSKKEQPSLPRRILYYMFGISSTDNSDERSRAIQERLTTMAALKQSSWEKKILSTGLVLIVALGIGVFIFFSVYKFSTAPFYPRGATTLLPGDEIFVKNLSEVVNTTGTDTPHDV